MGGLLALPRATLAYTLCSAVNGGLVGVAGPSLTTLGANTGLGKQELGQALFGNRLAKLAGSGLWTAYASALQERRAPFTAHAILSVCCLVIAACALVIATFRSSSLALQMALLVSGLVYGVGDSAITLLTVWEHHDPTQQRKQVAVLNVGFTIGALLTPAAVATAQLKGLTPYVGYQAIAALAALAAIVFAVGLPTAVNHREGAHHDGDTPRRSNDGPEPSGPDGTGGAAVARNGDSPAADSMATRMASRRAFIVTTCMALVLFSVTGCEHAVATWLPTYGQTVGGLSLGEMALMSSAYWGAICLGRVVWAAVSGALRSGFPALAFDAMLMLGSSTLIADFARTPTHAHAPTRPQWHRHRSAALGQGPTEEWAARPSALLLWVGTLGLGLGCSSSLPCAITLPAEAHVQLTPVRLLVLNLAGSAGEMLLPYTIGACFERARYGALGVSLLALEATVVVCTAIAWRVAARLKMDEAEEHTELRVRLVHSLDDAQDDELVK